LVQLQFVLWHSSHIHFGTATVCFVTQQSHAVWYSYSLFCDTAVTCILVQLQFVLWHSSHIHFGTATVYFVTKTAAQQGRCYKLYVHGALSKCCPIFRGLSANRHFYKHSQMQNKYLYSMFVLQAKTDPNFPKGPSSRFMFCKYKSIGGSYLEITTGPDSVWSDTPLVNRFVR